MANEANRSATRINSSSIVFTNLIEGAANARQNAEFATVLVTSISEQFATCFITVCGSVQVIGALMALAVAEEIRVTFIVSEDKHWG
ncbi:hypothetical protein DPV78_005164 [Talaromyces pinophilus]|nr:hypothetical protein DPV78_005164 [Talaromyces pinophilus]